EASSASTGSASRLASKIRGMERRAAKKRCKRNRLGDVEWDARTKARGTPLKALRAAQQCKCEFYAFAPPYNGKHVFGGLPTRSALCRPGAGRRARRHLWPARGPDRRADWPFGLRQNHAAARRCRVG